MTNVIYCIHNQCYNTYGEHVYKLGKTINLTNRLQGYATGFIREMEIKYKVQVKDITRAEQILFDKLYKYRVVPNREFFNADLNIIKCAMDDVGEIVNLDLDYIFIGKNKILICDDTKYTRSHTGENNIEDIWKHKDILSQILNMRSNEMLKMLFRSRTKVAEHFTDWITRTLFTIHFGTTEDTRKQIQFNTAEHKLIADLTGVDATSVKEVFKKSCDKFSCVYLFYLNTAKELRETMNIDKDIPDDYIIYKYGRTDDIERRTSEHLKTFANLKLKLFSYIDPLYVSNAECDIANFFNKYGTSINYQGSKEIVAVNPKDFKDIRDRYKSLFNEYGGRTKDLQLQMEQLKNKNVIMAKEFELQNTILTKDFELKNTILIKELEMSHKIIEMNNMELAHLKQVAELEKKVLQQEIIILKTK